MSIQLWKMLYRSTKEQHTRYVYHKYTHLINLAIHLPVQDAGDQEVFHVCHRDVVQFACEVRQLHPGVRGNCLEQHLRRGMQVSLLLLVLPL